MALQTQEAKNRLAVQKKFQKLFITKKFNIEEFNELYALEKNYVDLNFTYIHIEFPKIDSKDTLLINAAECKSDDKPIKIARLLKIPTLNINYQNKYGETALIECAYTCDSPEAFILLCNARTIQINLQDRGGDTALSHACWCKNKQYRFTCINILLKAGANPTIINDIDLTPLQIIKKMGDDQEIELIEKYYKKYQKK
jgi:ankyrin repeat protein